VVLHRVKNILEMHEKNLNKNVFSSRGILKCNLTGGVASKYIYPKYCAYKLSDIGRFSSIFTRLLFIFRSEFQNRPSLRFGKYGR